MMDLLEGSVSMLISSSLDPDAEGPCEVREPQYTQCIHIVYHGDPPSFAEKIMPSAKLFMHGGSQAVRLPKEFRFPGTEVHVRRVGSEVVLSAVPLPGPDTLIDALTAFEPGTVVHREQPAEQQRRAPIRTVR